MKKSTVMIVGVAAAGLALWWWYRKKSTAPVTLTTPPGASMPLVTAPPAVTAIGQSTSTVPGGNNLIDIAAQGLLSASPVGVFMPIVNAVKAVL